MCECARCDDARVSLARSHENSRGSARPSCCRRARREIKRRHHMKLTTFALIAMLAAPLVASADDTKGSTTTTDKSKTTTKTTDTNSNVPTNKSGTDKKTSGKIAAADLQVMSEMHHVN